MKKTVAIVGIASLMLALPAISLAQDIGMPDKEDMK